jgi:hypothetical protein
MIFSQTSPFGRLWLQAIELNHLGVFLELSHTSGAVASNPVKVNQTRYDVP